MDNYQNKLEEINQQQLRKWVNIAQSKINFGHLPQYIPLLAEANPAWLAVSLQTISGQIFSEGNVDKKFPLMSAIKPFVLFNLLCQLGEEAIFKKRRN